LYRGTANSGGTKLITYGAMPIVYNGGAIVPGNFSFAYIDTPGNASTTYTLVMQDPLTNLDMASEVYQRSMIVLALKK
jgi:hypothetical protein